MWIKAQGLEMSECWCSTATHAHTDGNESAHKGANKAPNNSKLSIAQYPWCKHDHILFCYRNEEDNQRGSHPESDNLIPFHKHCTSTLCEQNNWNHDGPEGRGEIFQRLFLANEHGSLKNTSAEMKFLFGLFPELPSPSQCVWPYFPNQQLCFQKQTKASDKLTRP